MKKKKFNLLLNIATLCLCVAAIVFGVYSAKNASLNVTGTIGFTSHNTKMGLTGSILACESASAIERKEATITSTSIEKAEAKLDLNKEFSGSSEGKMYFSDLFDEGKIIVITLTLTNNSDYSVKATAKKPTFASDKCTMSVKLDGTEMTESSKIISMKQSAITTMVITLTLTNENIDFTADVQLGGTLFDFAPNLTVNTINFGFHYFYDDSETGFFVDDTINCQAEEGMTVQEWVNSKYYNDVLSYDSMENEFTYSYSEGNEMDGYTSHTFTWTLSLSEILENGKQYECRSY